MILMAEATPGSLIGCSGSAVVLHAPLSNRPLESRWRVRRLLQGQGQVDGASGGIGPGRDRPRLRTGVICASDRVAPTSPPKTTAPQNQSKMGSAVHHARKGTDHHRRPWDGVCDRERSKTGRVDGASSSISRLGQTIENALIEAFN